MKMDKVIRKINRDGTFNVYIEKKLLIKNIGEEECNLIVELQEQVIEMQSKISALSLFGRAKICKKCKEYYPYGYVCKCGQDNSENNDMEEDYEF
jgi:predicted PP-loop superfamily ATPase